MFGVQKILGNKFSLEHRNLYYFLFMFFLHRNTLIFEKLVMFQRPIFIFRSRDFDWEQILFRQIIFQLKMKVYSQIRVSQINEIEVSKINFRGEKLQFQAN